MEKLVIAGPPITRIILYVKDIPKVAAFYRQFFGMRPLAGASEGWVELTNDHGDHTGCTIALHKAAVSQKSGAAMKLVFGVADVRAFKEASEKKGLKFGVVHSVGGVEFANAKDPAGNSIQISNRGMVMRPWVKALNSTVNSIKRLAEDQGVVIGEKEMAEKMGMTLADLMACLSGESKVPQKLLSELWPAYDYLMQDQLRAGKVEQLKGQLEMLRRLAAKDGLVFTNDEIAQRIGVPPDIFNGYLNGALEVPEGFYEIIFEAFRADVFRNIHHGHVTMRSVKSIEPLGPADEE